VPIARNEERTLPDAWWKIAGSLQREIKALPIYRTLYYGVVCDVIAVAELQTRSAGCRSAKQNVRKTLDISS
jgi:hypothetical protein